MPRVFARAEASRPKLIDISGGEPLVRDQEAAEANPDQVLQETIEAVEASSWFGNKIKCVQLLQQFDWELLAAVHLAQANALSITLDPIDQLSVAVSRASESMSKHVSGRISARMSGRGSEAEPAPAAPDNDDPRPRPMDAGLHALPTEPASQPRADAPDVSAAQAAKLDSDMSLTKMASTELQSSPSGATAPLSQRLMETLGRVSTVFNPPPIREGFDEDAGQGDEVDDAEKQAETMQSPDYASAKAEQLVTQPILEA